MKVIVTGHKGFIGQNMCELLRRQGHTAIGFGIDDPPPTLQEVSEVAAVMHFGAITSTSERNMDKLYHYNVLVPLRLAEYCRRVGTSFQYSSSAAVYGDAQTDTDFLEDSFCRPLNPYGMSKYMLDCAVAFKNPLAQGLRYFNVYGPHEEHKGDQASPIHKFTEQAKKCGVIRIFENSAECLRDFVSVKDVCWAHLALLETDFAGQINIGTGEARSFELVANLIAAKYKAEIEEIEMPEWLKGQYQYYTCADLTRFNEVVPNFQWKSVENSLL